MNIIVIKFGGTSLATIDHFLKASKKIKEISKKSKVIVVLSAMAGNTNSLVDLIKKVHDIRWKPSSIDDINQEELIFLFETHVEKLGL